MGFFISRHPGSKISETLWEVILMKALLYEGPRQIRAADLPMVSPKTGEVLLKIKACGICGSDVHGYLGTTGRRIAPMVMGHEFSGEIAEIGEGCSLGFRIGDRVTVQPVDFCGDCAPCRDGYTNTCLSKRFFGVLDVNGAFAEYLCVPEKLLYKLPDTVSFTEGALIEALAVAYGAIKKAGNLRGKNILIIGGGTIGQLVLSVVRTMEPKRVILSDLSSFRRETAKKRGADHVIDPGAVGCFTEEIRKLFGGELADVTVEAVGIGPTVEQALSALKPRGTCIWVGNNTKRVDIDMQDIVTRELKIFGTYIYTHEEFGETIKFMETTRLNLQELITKEISLEEAPDMFHRLSAAPDEQLKVVVTNEEENACQIKRL